MDTFKQTAKAASKNKHNASIVKILGACIFVCLVFCAGFLVRGNTELLSAMGLSSFDVDSEVNPGMTVSGDTYNSLSARVAEVDGVLTQNGMDEYDLSQATSNVLSAFLSSSNDPYLRYYDEQSYQAYLATTKNPEAGIGVLFGESDGDCFVADVLESSPAAAAGVQPGDHVVSIDGVSKDAWSAPDVLNALSREEGESVFIIWSRPSSESGEDETTYSTSLTFSSDSAVNVTHEVQDSVGIIKLLPILHHLYQMPYRYQQVRERTPMCLIYVTFLEVISLRRWISLHFSFRVVKLFKLKQRRESLQGAQMAQV